MLFYIYPSSIFLFSSPFLPCFLRYFLTYLFLSIIFFILFNSFRCNFSSFCYSSFPVLFIYTLSFIFLFLSFHFSFCELITFPFYFSSFSQFLSVFLFNYSLSSALFFLLFCFFLCFVFLHRPTTTPLNKPRYFCCLNEAQHKTSTSLETRFFSFLLLSFQPKWTLCFETFHSFCSFVSFKSLFFAFVLFVFFHICSFISLLEPLPLTA